LLGHTSNDERPKPASIRPATPGARRAAKTLICSPHRLATGRGGCGKGGITLDCRAMKRSDVEGWAAPVAVLVGIVALYAGTLAAGFINDDYLFLEQTRRYGLWGSLTHGSGLANFFRPLSREVWFGLLGPL